MSYICPKIYPFDLLHEVCVLFSVSSFCLVFQMVICDFTDIIDFLSDESRKIKATTRTSSNWWKGESLIHDRYFYHGLDMGQIQKRCIANKFFKKNYHYFHYNCLLSINQLWRLIYKFFWTRYMYYLNSVDIILALTWIIFFQGTARRKKKVVHRTATTDDKKLQSSLKKLSVNNIPGIEEVFSKFYQTLWSIWKVN